MPGTVKPRGNQGKSSRLKYNFPVQLFPFLSFLLFYELFFQPSKSILPKEKRNSTPLSYKQSRRQVSHMSVLVTLFLRQIRNKLLLHFKNHFSFKHSISFQQVDVLQFSTQDIQRIQNHLSRSLGPPSSFHPVVRKSSFSHLENN